MVFRNCVDISTILTVIIHLLDRTYSLKLGQTSTPGVVHSRRQSEACKTYMMIGARGTTEKQNYSVAYTQMAHQVLAALPGGGLMDITYSSEAEYVKTPKEGAVAGLTYIKAQVAKCPRMVFVLMGYSKGAMVATQILASKGLPPNKIVAVTLFGNPYWSAGAPQNACTAKTGKGIASQMGPQMMVKVPRIYVDCIWDCCLEGDKICQTTGSMEIHLKYSGQRAAEAQEFIIRKLKAKNIAGGISSPRGDKSTSVLSGKFSGIGGVSGSGMTSIKRIGENKTMS